MRILNTLPVRDVEAARAGARATRPVVRESAVDGVQLSSEGRFVQELRNEVGATTGLRPAVISQARADIAAGVLEADVDSAVDALLSGM